MSLRHALQPVLPACYFSHPHTQTHPKPHSFHWFTYQATLCILQFQMPSQIKWSWSSNGRLQMFSTNTFGTPTTGLCANIYSYLHKTVFDQKFKDYNVERHKTKKNPHKNVFADSSKRNQQHGCAVTGPRLVVQQLYIARHGRQEIDF